jgi:hypothetical protein
VAIEGASARPNRVAAIMSLLGGALAAGGFFLPTTLQVQTSPPGVKVVSGWDAAYRLATGGSSSGPSIPGLPGPGATPSLPFAAALAASPLILAVVVLVLAVWALFSEAGPLRNSLMLAAVALLAISSLSALSLSSALGSVGSLVGGLIADSGMLGLGSLVTFAGVFFAVTGLGASLQRKG